MFIHPDQLETIINNALAEDMPFGDLTTDLALPDPDVPCTAEALVKGQPLVAAGLDIACRVFAQIDPQTRFTPLMRDGDHASPGDRLFRVCGTARALLAGERVALNLLQHLTGIATETHRYVGAVEGTGVVILDTRKTTPGLRALEKAAVAAGGGGNHRFSLSDGILIKENHIIAGGGIRQVMAAVKAGRSGHLLKAEVEVTNLAELRQAVDAGADMLLLDNFTPPDVRHAVQIVDGIVPLEVSGGIDLDNIRVYAEAGPDFISVGRITHSAPAADISLLFLAERFPT